MGSMHVTTRYLLLCSCLVLVGRVAPAQSTAIPPVPGSIKPSAVLTFDHYKLTAVNSDGVTCDQ